MSLSTLSSSFHHPSHCSILFHWYQLFLLNVDEEDDTCMFILRNEEPEEAYLLQVKTE